MLFTVISASEFSSSSSTSSSSSYYYYKAPVLLTVIDPGPTERVLGASTSGLRLQPVY